MTIRPLRQPDTPLVKGVVVMDGGVFRLPLRPIAGRSRSRGFSVPAEARQVWRIWHC